MHFYNALAKYRQHDLEGAEKSVREAERLDKNRDIVSAWELLGVNWPPGGISPARRSSTAPT